MTTSTADIVCEITGNVQRCNDPIRVYSFILTDIIIVIVAAVIIYKFVTAKYHS